MLNRDRHILLNLRYSCTIDNVINSSESSIENVELSNFYNHFTKTPKIEYFHPGGLDTLSSQERLNQLS